MKLANFALGASLLSGLFTTPAIAASLANPTLGGAGDVILYNANSTNTFRDNNASLVQILQGDASNPLGNVELFASSESGASFSTPTTLSGILNGTSLTLSSLTAADWDIFGRQWFSEFLNVSLDVVGQQARAQLGDAALYTIFSNSRGREFFSDPNISYINQDDTTGMIKIGLAGHLNAFSRISTAIPQLKNYLKPQVQASEIVKVTYGNGPAQYLWSFSATASGRVERGDGASHNGNYEVSFMGQLPPSESVPEPASVLGLVALGGLLLASKRKSTLQ
jgi:hypothetical protein